MGIFDRILGEIKDEIKSELSKLIDPDSADAEETAASDDISQECDNEQPFYENNCNRSEEYFAAFVTAEKFPGYTIERTVHPNVFDASAHPKCYPITFLFRKDGAPVLAVMVMNSNQSRAMISVGTYRVLDAQKIPYIRFYREMENREDYVINRIRDNLA